MKIHYAELCDRFVREDGRAVIRARDDSGRIFNIFVPDDLRDIAARHWGGSRVPYTYRGGRAYYVDE